MYSLPETPAEITSPLESTPPLVIVGVPVPYISPSKPSAVADEYDSLVSEQPSLSESKSSPSKKPSLSVSLHIENTNCPELRDSRLKFR